jgi:hypothetical protein
VSAIANFRICATVHQMRKAAVMWMTTRSSVAVLSLAAWFLLSNHCALGAIVLTADSEPQMSGCPMHSAPAKKKTALKMSCCKDVRAVVAKGVGAIAPGVRLITPPDYAPKIFRILPGAAIAVQTLDTGPPGRISFAELILQESLFSHAPPVS